MSPATEMQILNLYKRKPLSKAIHALEVMKLRHANKILDKRLKLQGLVLGD